ncbi:imidazole glycerol phosphate synthase subunit HisH [Cloacibacterium sp. Arc13]|uniref:imidazole glycerol phosphate synthase subunit HisH n=1 Tax=unclassified Cloacibacterium TaxID=2620870 RepID=UPI00352DA760
MIAIIDYDAGNVKSVQNALKKLGFDAEITSDIETIKNAEKVIFPGVGEASSAMKKLQERGLDAVIPNLKQPVLGICLGMQLMCNSSEEGNTNALGIFDCEVKLFPNSDIVPHMGWNNVSEIKGKLLKNISETDNFYFVHSFYATICKNTSSVCDYITPFSATLEKDNFYAAQFHPEKSGDAGFKLLENFLNLRF